MASMQIFRMADFMVHIRIEGIYSYFKAYPVCDGWDGGGNKIICYSKKDDEETSISMLDPDFDEKECVCKLCGSMVWRGEWEDRLYFPDDEYWGEELLEMSKLYSEYIKPVLKTFVRLVNPNAPKNED